MAHQVRHLMLLCALVLAAPFAAAQRPGQIAIRFTVFSARPIDGLAYASATGAAQPLQFKPAARSPRYTYTGVSPLKFTDTASGAVVAEATVPPEIREPLLLFIELPAPKPGGLRYQIAVIDDSAAKLGAGHLAILNLSGLKLTGLLDKTELTIDAGLNAPVPFTRSAKLTLFTTARGVKVQSYADVIKPPKTSRLLLILFPPARKGALEVQTRALADDPNAPAPAPAGVPVPGVKK
ncbi:MAG: hypothetical protein NTV51_12710 [Verrucomicrobia bacterium]|nr:hypothetical protein [Verrucomicrobiota bacterium]